MQSTSDENHTIQVAAAKKLVKSGMDKYYDEDFKGAIDDFTKAIELDSNFVDAYSSRGYAKNKLEDYKGAIADFSRYLLDILATDFDIQ